MAEICPICEGSRLRVVERANEQRVLESCECDEGRRLVQDFEARIPARPGGSMEKGRRQRLKEQYGSIEKIPTSMLTPDERLRWMTDENGSYETWPAELKAAHAEHEPKTIPPNREAIATLKAHSQPKREQVRAKPAPFTNGMAGMNGKIRGLDPPMSEADLMAWWESEGKEG